MLRYPWLAQLCALLMLASCSSPPSQGNNGESNNGAQNNGVSNNGASNNGASNNGASNNGMSNNGTDNNGEVVPDGALTYWADVRPIMDAHCITCHSGSGIAPYDWREPTVAKSLAGLIETAVTSGIMPPWYPSDKCEPVKGDLRLDEGQIETFSKWANEGAYIGDPDSYVAGEEIPADIGTARLTNDEQMELRAPVPYDVPTEFTNYFRCFTIDSGFATRRYMSGFEVIPDNRAVLHHMLLFAVGGGQENTAQLAALEAEDPEPGFDCFGSPGVSDLSLAGAWAPGGGTVGFPQGTALPLEPGTKFVMQMHYNIAEASTGNTTDNSGARIWLLPEGDEPTVEGQLVLVGNLPFEVPAGVNGLDAPDEDCEVVYDPADDAMLPPTRGYSRAEVAANPSLVGSSGCVTQELYYRLPVPLRVHSVAPHMHLMGKSMRVEILPFEESATSAEPVEDEGYCAMDMPLWDFNWQRIYWLEQPVRVPAEGVVRLTCRYDNTEGSGPIRLGDGSEEEMCLALFYLSL